jgi:hypothetical protein
VSDDGLTLELARTAAAPRRPVDLAFRIRDRDGRTVRDFDVEHTRRMHFIVVRRDMTGFQHLHPAQAADGTWTVPVALHDAGSYRVFADFSVDGEPHTLAGDLTVDGAMRARPLPPPARTADVDGMRVTLTEGASRAGAESQLRFSVTRDGRPVAVDPYLGARGHLVALREGDLEYLHVHPVEDAHVAPAPGPHVAFAATAPSAGPHRLFLDFRHGDAVHTAAFTVQVTGTAADEPATHGHAD